jgi:hypothetical protein
MNGERAALVATDPPYLVDYKGGDHPFASADSAARRAIKNKDRSDTYREGAADEFFAKFIATGIAVPARLREARAGDRRPLPASPAVKRQGAAVPR